jgi:hypothetical protein
MKRSTGWYAVTTTILSAIHVSSALSQSCCVVPQHETTTAIAGPAQRTRFSQKVYTDSNLNFDGVWVREGNGTGGTSFDGCWFPGSAQTKYETLTGGEWQVGAAEPFQSQFWGYDHLGWAPGDISYYRAQRPARGLSMPCNTRLIQKMEELCPPNWDVYTQSNVLTLYIDMTTVTNCRSDISNSTCNTQNY